MAARRGMISSLAQYIHNSAADASVLVWKGRCIRAAGAPTQRNDALKAQRHAHIQSAAKSNACVRCHGVGSVFVCAPESNLRV